MKSYLELSNRTIKIQKKRAVLTIIGIILSVALITGLGTLVLSWQQAFIQDAIRNNGDYHTSFTQVNPDSAKKIMHHLSVKNSFFIRQEGYAIMADNGGKEGQPPHQYLYVISCSTDTFPRMSIELKEGRFPTEPDEIILDYWTLKNFPEGTIIGDTITLGIGDRFSPQGVKLEENLWDENEVFKQREAKTYRLVGLIEPRVIADRIFAQAFSFIHEDMMKEGEVYDVFINLRSVKNAPEDSEAIAKASGVTLTGEKASKISYNERVLRLMGESTNPILDKTMLTILSIIVLLIVTATIAVIYNAFNMSVIEKVSQFGLLRCVGATPRQINSIVNREALILALVGIPLGVLSGTLAISILIKVIKTIAAESQFASMSLVISYPVLLGSIVIGFITVFLSAWLPAKRAGRVSPMEAVRNTGEIRKEKFKHISRSKGWLGLLGPEGWIAWKNLGRNRRRFYITVFSMVISIVLFIAFGSLVDFAYKAGVIDMSSYPHFAISNSNYSESLKLPQEDERQLLSIPGLETLYRFGDTYGQVILDKEKVNQDIYTVLNQPMETDAEGRALLYNSQFITYGNNAETALKSYLIDGKADIFDDGDRVLIVNAGKLYDTAKQRTVYMDVTTLKPGDQFTLSVYSEETEGVKDITLTVAGVLSQGVFGETQNTLGGIQVIGSEELFKKVMGRESFPERLYIQMDKGADSLPMRTFLEEYTAMNPGLVYLDYHQASREYETTMLVISIFIYGFISVIALIGSVNIVNTISTNIILRRRELSMLKAVGATQKGILKLVRLESLFHGMIAVIIGTVLGCLLSKVLYNTVIAVGEFQWSFPTLQVILAVLGTLLITILSGQIPLKRINETVIIEGIRGEE